MKQQMIRYRGSSRKQPPQPVPCQDRATTQGYLPSRRASPRTVSLLRQTHGYLPSSRASPRTVSLLRQTHGYLPSRRASPPIDHQGLSGWSVGPTVTFPAAGHHRGCVGKIKRPPGLVCAARGKAAVLRFQCVAISVAVDCVRRGIRAEVVGPFADGERRTIKRHVDIQAPAH